MNLKLYPLKSVLCTKNTLLSALFTLLLVSINVVKAQNTLDNLGYSGSDPKPEATYSLRLLSSAYTGPLVRVTISGNTYDVWPDGTGAFSMSSVISAANPGTVPGTKNGSTALSTVASSATATIAIWYDQSGNTYSSGTVTNNVTQATVSQQPRIINSGTIDKQNGQPAAYFNAASSQVLYSTTRAFYNFGSAGASLLSVWDFTGTGVSALFALYESASSNYLNVTTTSTNVMRFESGINGNNIQTTTEGISNGNLYQQSCTGNEQRLNGTNLQTGGNTGLMSGAFTSQFQIGYYTGYWTGYASEIICFPSTLSSSLRQTAENNQINYYKTTGNGQTYTAPGNALSFDGSSTYVNAALPNYLTANGNSFTAEAWVNPSTLSTASEQTIFGYGYDDGSTGNGIQLMISTTGTLQVLFSAVTGALETGYTFPSANKWYHVAMTRYSGVTKFFVNGVQTGTTYGTTPNTPSEFRLGSQHGIRFFNGKMDEFRLYNYPLDATAIQADMFSTSANSSGLAANLITHYNFDQGTAGGNNLGFGYLPDLQNNWPGYLNNFALTGSSSNWVESYALVVPTATSATSVTSSGFTANWTAPANGTVTNYLVDVTNDAAFSSPISGSPFTVASPTTSKAVTGLSGGTYYYRVRADKTSVTGQGGYSNSISQAITYTPPGNALSFDGSTTFVDAAIPNYLTANGSSYTMETWINPSTLSTSDAQTIFHYGYDDNSTGNGVQFVIGGTSGATGQIAGHLMLLYSQQSNAYLDCGYTFPTANKWYHVAVTFYNNVFKFYVNGVQTTNTLNSYTPTTPTDFRLGAENNCRYFNGKMDEFRLYNYPLDAAHIQSDMLSTTSSLPGNLITYYNFDEGVANATNTGITSLTDNAGTYTGTLHNFALTGTSSNWVESYAMVVPTATAATSVTSSGFTANWTAPAAGTVDNGYKVDVATDAAFASPISGSPFTVASGTSQAVSSVAPGTYYYRVRADKTSVTGQGGYSNSVSQAVTLTAPGNALNFNGSNTYVQVNHNSVLNSSSYTLECWVNINSFTSLGGFISKYNTGATYGYRLSLNGTSPYSGINFDGLETANGIFETGKWYHVTAVNNAGTRTLYVNGVQVSMSGSSYSVNVSNTDFVTFGVDYLNIAARYLNGKMDQVRIYNTALTSSQIQADMLSTTAAVPGNLVASYNFDQGVSGATNTGINTLTDQTSNHLDGALINFALTGSTSNWVESYAMAVPTATAATAIGNTSFTANWTAPTVGTVDNNYRLDVSTSASFASFVSGYNGLTVSGTSKAVTGISSGVTYYYRVRADKTSVTGEGANSNSINYTIAAWNGSHDTDWGNGLNWSPANAAPTSSDDVDIPENNNHEPNIGSSTNATARNITIQNHVILNISTGGTLTATNVTVNPGGSLTGDYSQISANAILQQNVVAQRGFRVFANPFSTAQTIANVASNNAITINVTPRPSTLTDSRTFDNSSNAWSNVTGTTWAANTPYALFIRGLASEVNGLSYSGGPTGFVYNVNGTLNGNSSSVTPANASNFMLVGNPFAAPIKSSALTSQTTGRTYYTYQIAQGGLQSAQRTAAGSWVASGSTSDGTHTIPVLGVVAYLPPNSTSFNVTTSDLNASGTLQTGLFGIEPPASQLELLVEQNGDFKDKLFVKLDAKSISTGIDITDLPKFYNDVVNLYTVTPDNNRMAIDARNVLSTIPLGMYGAAGNYNFKLNNNNLPEGTTVTLIDKYLNTQTVLKAGDVYNFTISADAASYGEQRFILSFSSKSIAVATDPSGNLTATVLGNITSSNLIAVQIAGAEAPVTISIKDMSGRAISNSNAVNGIQYVNVGNTASGMLLLQISDGKNSVTKKVIKL